MSIFISRAKVGENGQFIIDNPLPVLILGTHLSNTSLFSSCPCSQYFLSLFFSKIHKHTPLDLFLHYSFLTIFVHSFISLTNISSELTMCSTMQEALGKSNKQNMLLCLWTNGKSQE